MMSLRPGSINLPRGHRCCRVGLLSRCFVVQPGGVSGLTTMPNRVSFILFTLTIMSPLCKTERHSPRAVVFRPVQVELHTFSTSAVVGGRQ